MLKVFVAMLLIVCVACALMPALAEEQALRDVTKDSYLKMTLKKMITQYGEDGLVTHRYHVQQGSCTDGQYAYIILENQTDHLGSIWKYDLQDWSLVNHVYGLEIDHGNDMCYNPKLGMLVVCHNAPNYTRLSLVDPETLEIVKTWDQPRAMYSITYNETRDQYAVGISGTYDYAILDGDFKEIAYYHGKDTGLVKQGMDSDDTYIYFPQNKKDNSYNALQVYDWEGNFINTVRVSSYQEIESLFHVGDQVYIAFNASGGHVYKATLTQETMPR